MHCTTVLPSDATFNSRSSIGTYSYCCSWIVSLSSWKCSRPFRQQCQEPLATVVRSSSCLNLLLSWPAAVGSQHSAVFFLVLASLVVVDCIHQMNGQRCERTTDKGSCWWSPFVMARHDGESQSRATQPHNRTGVVNCKKGRQKAMQ